MRHRVVVIGGGLTGLATAWRLRERHDVVLLEASRRLGGEVCTVTFGGTALDVGAEAVLARRPEGLALLDETGFTQDDVVAPAAGEVRVWTRGRLRPLPPATVLGIPTDLAATVRSGVLPWPSAVRVAAEPFVPRQPEVADRSVADLVGHRFGGDVVTTLVEPLLGGVYAGRADRLSARATMPEVWAASQEARSLTRALAARRRESEAASRPVFVTLVGGLSRLVERLASDLRSRVHLGDAATSVRRAPDGWRVRTATDELRADAVVVAVPPGSAADLLAECAPLAARQLAAVRTASVAVVALGYDAAAAACLPPGVSGYLAPRAPERLVKAVTFASRKWAHHALPDRFVLRASVGRIDDTHALELDDDTLSSRVDAEVRQVTGIRMPAVEQRVVRWPEAIPQYEVGHLARVGRIRAALRQAPSGLHLGGAALDGVGLAARAADAVRLAAAVDQERQAQESS